mgnify:CR=1 FL=1
MLFWQRPARTVSQLLVQSWRPGMSVLPLQASCFAVGDMVGCCPRLAKYFLYFSSSAALIEGECLTLLFLSPPLPLQILPEFFRNFWVRRMALDRRNYRALVETTVEIALKVGNVYHIIRLSCLPPTVAPWAGLVRCGCWSQFALLGISHTQLMSWLSACAMRDTWRTLVDRFLIALFVGFPVWTGWCMPLIIGTWILWFVGIVHPGFLLAPLVGDSRQHSQVAVRC